MVVKVHLDGENRRRLIVRGRDVAFWWPGLAAVVAVSGTGLVLATLPNVNIDGFAFDWDWT